MQSARIAAAAGSFISFFACVAYLADRLGGGRLCFVPLLFILIVGIPLVVKFFWPKSPGNP